MFSSHFYHNVVKLFLRHFPEMPKIYFYNIVIKMLRKCDDYFFDPITFSRHFYDNLIKMLKMYKFIVNDFE